MIPEEIKNIEKILVSFLGKSKNGMSDNGQIQFACPKCVEEKGHKEASKFNLEVNLYRMVYKCWSCSSSDGSMEGRLSSLIRKYGNLSLYNSYKEQVESLAKSKLYDINAYDILDQNSNIGTELFLPSTFQKIDLSTCKNESLVEYLNGRSITQDIIDRFNIGYTKWEKGNVAMSNRIVIPSYDAYGDLNFWVGRDFTGKAKNKYRNCTANKNNIVFQESEIDFDADIVLCEGAIDCLYCPNGIALLGKVLTSDTCLYRTLYERANANIIVCLDADTDISETKKIYTLLNHGRLEGRIRYVRMDKYKDIGELYQEEGRKGLINFFKNTRVFTEYQILFE